MFSVIITIVSIALVAILVLATAYFGVTYAKDGTVRAATARAIQEGNQITGALELYKSDHDATLPTGTSEQIKQELLSSNYLTAWPETPWEFQTDYVVRTGMTQDACTAINKQLGVNEIPSCDNPAYTGKAVCCTKP